MRKAAALLLILALVPSGFSRDKVLTPGPIRLDRDGEKWAQKTLKKMSLEQKIGQMFMVWARADFLNINSPEYLKLVDALHKYHLGGFGLTVPVDGPFLLKNQPYEAAMLTNALQREAEFPLLFAADYERGLSMRMTGVTGFPHAMAFGATGNPQYANDFGRITAEESRAVGVHWNFFPDADVNSNPANPIINTRSFGEDPQQVGAYVKDYILGARASGLLTTAKHFPGHGDTDTDTHLAMARVNGSLERLEQVELVPFEQAITAGVDAIMVAHVSVPALDPDPNHVASISPAITTDLLRHKMGFRGLIVTDALDMNALMGLFASDSLATASGRAAVAAVKAGSDMILIPADLGGSYDALLRAVKSGEIPESRIDESVLRILQAKASVGLNKAREVDIDSMSSVIGRPENLALAQKIADDAVTLVRYNGQSLPLQARSLGTSIPHLAYQNDVKVRNRVLAVIFTDDMRSENGRAFERQLRLRIPDARIVYVDGRTAGPMTPELMQTAAEAQKVIAAVYVIPSAGRTANGNRAGSVGMQEGPEGLLSGLIRQFGSKTVLLAMGNPYIAQDYPEVQNYLCTFSNAPVSELSAVKALFGEIRIHGHLPVTIPNIAPRGNGIELPVYFRQ